MAQYLLTYTKEQLLERGAAYWDKNDKMFASSDGQFFYENGESYCDSHVRDNKLQKFVLTKQEYLNLKNPPKTANVVINNDDTDEIKELKAFLKEKGVKVHPKTGLEKLRAKKAETE